jgi:uncharacterized membrane protein required for colicin V production
MGILDFVLLGWIAIFVVFGIYRGFLVSAAKTASYFVSFIAAYLLHPLLSMLLSGKSVISILINYTEGAAKLNLVSINQVYLPVSSLDAGAINNLVDKSKLVSPFANLVKQNMIGQTLASKGLTTVGDYFNYSVAYATLNILTMLLLFIIFRFAIGLIIDAMSEAHPFPVLKHYDGLLGGILGFVRGVFSCYLIVALLPVALCIVDASSISEYVLSFPLLRFFYSSNFVLLLTRGRIL